MRKEGQEDKKKVGMKEKTYIGNVKGKERREEDKKKVGMKGNTYTRGEEEEMIKGKKRGGKKRRK